MISWLSRTARDGTSLLRIFLCLWVGLALTTAANAEPIEAVDSQLDRPVEFYRDLYPILASNCLACHNSQIHESDLNLESAETLLRGGASGEAVVAGQPDESLVYQLAARREEPVMPPLPNKMHARPLSGRELGILRDWIKQGAQPGARPVDQSMNWQAIPETYRAVYSLAIDPFTLSLAAGRGNRIVLFDLVSLREIDRLTDPQLQGLRVNDQPLYGPGVAHRDFVHALAMSPNGQTLASGDYRAVKLWERQPPSLVGELTLGAAPRQFAIAPGGTVAACLLESGEVHLWKPLESTPGPQLRSPGQKFTAIAFAPNGESLVTADEAGTLQRWDVWTGLILSQRPTTGPITAVAVREQGKQVIAAHADHVLRLWDWPEETPHAITPLREFPGHAERVTGLAFLPGGNEFLSGSDDQTVRLWNCNESAPRLTEKLAAAVTKVAVSPDGKALAAADQAGKVHVWNQEGKLLAEFGGDIRLLRQIAELNDSITVAGQQIEAARQRLSTVQSDRDQRRTSADQAAKEQQQANTAVQEAATKLEEARNQLQTQQAEQADSPDAEKKLKPLQEAHQRAEEALIDARDQLTVAKRNADIAAASLKSIEADVAQREQTIQNLTMHRDELEATRTPLQKELATARPIASLAFSPDSATLLTAGQNQPVQQWQASQGRPLNALSLSEDIPVMAAWSSANLLVGVDSSGRETSWDLSPRWSCVATLGPPADAPLDLQNSAMIDRVQALAWSPDGKTLAVGGGEPSRSGEIQLWNIESRQPILTLTDPHSDVVLSLTFSRDGERLFSGAADKFVKMFRTSDGQWLRTFEGHTDHVLSVAIKADGTSLASGSADQTIKIWDIESGEQQRTIDGFTRQVTTVAYLGLTDKLLVGSGDKSVRFVDAANGSTLLRFQGAQDFVYAAVATPDETMVVASGEDGVVRVWNGQTAQPMTTFPPPTAARE